MDTRLLLVSHASTAAQRAGRFPADDPLDARGLAEVEAHAARLRLAIADDAPAFVSPAACARETAAALGLAASVEAGLADLNYGKWQGRRLADLAAEAPQDIAAWTSDPDAAPHGGESFSQLVKRMGEWLEASSDGETDRASTRPRNVFAVTHAPVLRAAIVYALGASPAVFSRIEIAPLSIIELRRSSRGWTWWPGPH
ncbi:histidine phosphatase family protein [Paraburkholderia phytofirmans]|uniref:histidine phosphatase family protein n=1 Tax=Paraburkholderia phytofirmans TaxID=261302 RepID=UPI0038BB5311